MAVDDRCSFAGCDRPVFVREPGYGFGGLCNGHYKQLKTALAEKRPLVLAPLRSYKSRPAEGESCAFPDCGRPRWGKGIHCQTHQRLAREGNLRPIRGHESQRGRICAVEGCGKAARAKGLCAAHYSQMRNRARKEEHDQEDRGGSQAAEA